MSAGQRKIKEQHYTAIAMLRLEYTWTSTLRCNLEEIPSQHRSRGDRACEWSIHRAHYAAHSFRRGRATWALQCGLATDVVRVLGDWKSDAYLAYIDIPLSSRVTYAQSLARCLPKWFRDWTLCIGHRHFVYCYFAQYLMNWFIVLLCILSDISFPHFFLLSPVCLPPFPPAFLSSFPLLYTPLLFIPLSSSTLFGFFGEFVSCCVHSDT